MYSRSSIFAIRAMEMSLKGGEGKLCLNCRNEYNGDSCPYCGSGLGQRKNNILPDRLEVHDDEP